MPDSTNLDITDALTIEVWIRSDVLVTGGSIAEIVDKGDCLGGGYALRVLGGSHVLSAGGAGDGRLNFAILTSPFPNLNHTLRVDDGQFHHVAGVFDGTTIRVYVDGVEEAFTPVSVSLTTNDQNLNIGRGSFGPCQSRLFQGVIDEVEIFDRALSSEEIQDIFIAGSGGKCKIPQAVLDVLDPADVPPDVLNALITAVQQGLLEVVDASTNQDFGLQPDAALVIGSAQIKGDIVGLDATTVIGENGTVDGDIQVGTLFIGGVNVTRGTFLTVMASYLLVQELK